MTDQRTVDASPRDKSQGERDEEAALAKTYRQAAAGDAHHERAGGGPSPGGRDPTLVPTPEVPDKPLPDVAQTDAARGGSGNGCAFDLKGNGGAVSEAELDGLEPGEMKAGHEPDDMPEQVTRVAGE